MPAFNFDLLDYGKCVSKKNITCSYSDGMFNFNGYEIAVGNSLENNYGGIGGFVGPNHEYFLYCGSKYPEIAIVKFNKDTDEWENHSCMQWFNIDIDTDDDIFSRIWFTKKKPALIFQPRKKYRKAVMEHEDLVEGMWCIKLNLSTGRCTGISKKQFRQQKHSALDKYSIWPLLSLGNDPLEVEDSGHSLSGDTLCEDEILVHPPQLEGISNQIALAEELLKQMDLQNKIVKIIDGITSSVKELEENIYMIIRKCEDRL